MGDMGNLFGGSCITGSDETEGNGTGVNSSNNVQDPVSHNRPTERSMPYQPSDGANGQQDGVSTVQPRVEPENEVIINQVLSQMGLEDHDSPSLQQEVPPPQANGIQSSAEPQQRNEEQVAEIDERPQNEQQNRVINEEQRSEDGAESETVQAQDEAAPALSEDPSVADSPTPNQPVANQPGARMPHHPPFGSTVGLPSDGVIGQQGSLSATMLGKKVTESVIVQLKLAETIGANWKFVGRHLNLVKHVLENIENDYSKTEEKSYQMLIKWLETSGNTCTVKKLVTALKDAQRTDLADTVLAYYQRIGL